MKAFRSILVFLMLITAISQSSACKVVPATEVNVNPPERIPLWIAQHYDDLCGYYTTDGYFATIFELDAFYRWKYPDIYDPRIYNYIYTNCHGERCLNKEFLKWYWSNPDEVRDWLRKQWKYPRDWRELIPLSKMLYIEGGKSLKALDKAIAISPELVRKARQKYGTGVNETEATTCTFGKREVVLVDGKVPTIYTNMVTKYETLERIVKEALSNPVTWTLVGLVAVVVVIASTNAVAVAILVYNKKQPKYKFFKKLA